MDNDGIGDTPRSNRANSCFLEDTCPDDLPDMVENIMNALLQDCRSVFTKGQVGFMRNTIEEFRPKLYQKIKFYRPGPLDEFTHVSNESVIPTAICIPGK